MEDLTIAKVIHDTLEQLYPVIITIIAGLVSIALLELKKYILTRTNEQQRSLATSLARTAVMFVEQTEIGADSKLKLAKAKEMVNAHLKLYGLNLTSDQILANIEAAVLSRTSSKANRRETT